MPRISQIINGKASFELLFMGGGIFLPAYRGQEASGVSPPREL